MKQLIKKFVPNGMLAAYQRRKALGPYYGHDVTCPICGAEYKKFGPYGVVPTDNRLCFNCGSLERHRLLWKYLHERTDLFTGTAPIRVLHFAAEKIFNTAITEQKRIEYVPCDLVPELYTVEGATPVVKADITAIPFSDDHFDVILCNHVLEHIPDDRLAMRETYRVMKKGGWGIFQVPIDYTRKTTYEDFSITSPEARQKAFGQKDHVRWYGQDYPDRLRSVGFDVKEEDFVHSFSEADRKRFVFREDEIVYFCRK